VSAMACGIDGPVVFNVQAGSGPYTEQVTIPAISGASNTNTITFNGNGTTLQAKPVTSIRHIIRLDGADYVTIDNLKIVPQAGSTFGWGIHLSNGADRNTISNCTIDMSATPNTFQSTSAGIVGSNSTTNATADGNASYNTISNNTITGAFQGIIINGTVGSLSALNNTITGNTIKDFYNTGIELRDNDAAVVSYNDINRKTLVAVGLFTGIELKPGNRKCTVNANRIHDTHTAASTQTGIAYGIWTNNCDAVPGVENKITNNIIYKFNSTSGTIYALYNFSSDYTHYFHNTVVLDHAGATSAGTTAGFYQTSAATGIELKNNIIYITRGGTSLKYCLYFATSTSSIVSNKNVLYLSPISSASGIGYWNLPKATLVDWKAANNNAYDQQSVSANPLFVNAAAGDFTPMEATVDNIGEYVGVVKDIDDRSRSVSSPDAGALEFVVPPCTGTPAPGVAATSLSSVCNSATPFTLSVTGASTGTGLTYQWERSTDNVNWSAIPGATNLGYTSSGITATTYFRRMITCSGASTYTVPVVVTFAAPNYATLPFSESFEAGWLDMCSVKDVPNNYWRTVPATGANSWRRNDNLAGFGSYTPTASSGTYSARFNTVNVSNFGVGGRLDLYLDANTPTTRKRLTFDYINPSGNDSLVVYLSTDNGSSFVRLDSVRTTTVWKTKTILFDATSATTILRFEGISDVGSSDIGLDNVKVIDYADCSGTPAGGTATSSAANVCTESFTLNVTGATDALGISYQWQSSTDNTNWTNISGATATSLTTTQLVTTYYRLMVTCSNGGSSAPSSTVMVSSPAFVSGTFTINKAVPTGGTNFQSFNDAYNYIRCGINGPVVFNVVTGSGPYDEQLIMQPVRGTSATNTITFNGNGATLSYLSTNTNERAVIKLNGADYVTINDLVITAKGATTGQYGFGVQLINDADNNTINNCTINIDQASALIDFAGIVVNSAANAAVTAGATKCDNNTFSGNTISGGQYGITLVGATTEAAGGAIGNNQVVNNTIKEFYKFGVYVSGSFNTLIEGNTISRPARTNLGDFNGIYFTGLSTKANINRNTITNPFGAAPNSILNFNGIYFTSVASLVTFENVVSNNRIYNLNGSGSATGIANFGSHSARYYHNTISMDGSAPASTSVYLTIGFFQSNKADGLEFKNNIITISRDGLSAKTAIHMNTNTTTMVSDRNDFFISSTTGVINMGYWNTYQGSLANWRSTTGQDAHSASTNPMYTDPTNGDLKPQNAAINDLGAFAGVAKDFDGVTRNTATPDMGAYEFTPPTCVVPPVAGTVAVSQTPVCDASPVMLTVSGNSSGTGQTFQWQMSTSATGPFTNMGNVLTNPDTAIMSPSINMHYRLAVSCGAQTSYSEPVSISITQPLPGGTYTINKKAPASANNFLSFNAAKAAMSCGITGPVVFNVVSGSGPYNEQLVLDSIRNASEVYTVTFNGNGDTIKFSSLNEFDRAVIKLNGADHITLDNLVIDATGSGIYGWGVQLINNADSNTIRNCTINTDKASTSINNFAGIVMSAASNSPTLTGATLCDANTITGNTINGGYYGITLLGSSTAYIKNNRIINNKIYDFTFAGIYISGNSGTLVEGNELACPTRNNNAGFAGIYASNASEKLRISKNRIHDPFAVPATNTFYGIYFQSNVDAPVAFPNIISNNLIYNINKASTVYGINNNGSDNALYYHNTVSLDDAAYASNAATYGFYQNSDAEGIELKNNLFTINRGGTGFKYALFFNTPTTRFVSDYNNIYQTTGATSVFGFLNANRVTLAAWKTATGKDLNTSTIDPMYVNPAAGDFKPRTPNMDNRGTGVGITTDIEGVARHTSSPDVGAYEFAVPPCTTPPAAGTATANPSSAVCMGTPVLLSLNDNSFGSGISFQWEYATSASGPYLPLGAPKLFPDTLIEASATLYYRAAVTCSGNTQYSAPVLVNISPNFLLGDYTINPAQPPSATNFQSFTAAVAALDCGITGPVTFKVAPGTYTEQIRMHKIAGAASNSRVTFQSADGNPSSVTLKYKATSAKNYVLQLDSASHVTYKDMTITSIDSVYGRVIELANTASYDSLANLVINAPINDTTGTSVAGIYAVNLKGGSNVIGGNTVNNGANGIYLRGTSETNLTPLNVIEGNTINGAYHHSIQAYYTSRIRISNNTVNMGAPISPIAYGILAGYCDSAYQVTGNKVNIINNSSAAYGIYVYYCDATAQERGRVAGNTVLATTNNTGTIFGLSNYYSTYNNTVNNVVSIKTTGGYSYSLYSYEDDYNNYYNNSIYSSATSATNNHAGHFYHIKTVVDVRNNIFAHNGGGRAIYTYDPLFSFTDYNMLYTNGAVLVEAGMPASATYADLQSWRNATSLDLNSIAYKPAFTSDVDLRPNLSDSTVWAMHGRGVQIAGNDYDFNNDPRPTTLTTGVPDLGAYEFVPTSVPPVLTAIPAAPAAGITQTFMMGTDTVSKITWGTTVPSTISMRRYSGVTPPGLTPATPHMYYYTDVQTTGSGMSGFSKKDFFIDPWQGWIKHQYQVRLGRTDAAGSWMVGANSQVDTSANIITENELTQLFKFTGLVDVNAVPPLPVVTQQIDSSNVGKRFWVGYAKSSDFNGVGGNGQDMVLYLSAGAEPATVTVKVNGTSWVKTYRIPANTVITSDRLPKAGFYDSRLMDEGKSDRGISIESDEPIVAYAHIYNDANSGATMLLPVGTYGYEYYTLNARQFYDLNDTHSSFFVVADRDSTTVEITPSNPTHGGRPANVPFTVMLNRGEVYQVLGAYIGGAEGYDLTGSKIKSVPNASGKCYPIAVFAGSSRTRVGCSNSTIGGGDLLFQQVFPSQAWGTRYLTAPTSIAATASSFQTNIYRVMVKDPATQVKVNGQLQNNLVANRYYEFESITADYIEADKPVMVAQYMGSSNSVCAGSTSIFDGDPELFYLSPIQQAVKKAGFYRNNMKAIQVNYLTLTIPTGGLASLTIDGSNVFDHTYAHPNLPGYTVVVRRWGNSTGQSWVQSDSSFTGIVYGEGSVESYGYNVGTLVKNLNAMSSITNTLSTMGGTSEYTCTNAPFKVSILVPMKPTTLTLSFSKATGITPNADMTLISPVAVDSLMINGKKYYKYVVSQDYKFNKVGTYIIPVSYTHPEIEGCNNSLETTLTVKVVQAPLSDFAVDFTNCIGDVAKFSGSGGAGVTITQWNWNLGDGSNSTIQNPTRQYAAPGNYDVNLKLVTPDGCVGDTTKKVAVNARPVVDVVKDSLAACSGSPVIFKVKEPATGITYNWYDAATGGALIGSGDSFTATISGTVANYYLEAVSAGCASTVRKKVTAVLLPNLDKPVVVVDSAGVNMVRFKWSAVANASGYEISTDGGATWSAPSSGATGLTHTVSGLLPLQSVTLIVRTKGGCQDVQSVAVTGKALVDQVFVPNSFSPNGDGLNDVLQVYGYVVKEMQFQVFNQWGQKIHESRDQKRAWDGSHKGKLQPSGVYLYVCKLILNDGSVITKKGAINLVR
jgi:trimeric autotransporter adhesin